MASRFRYSFLLLLLLVLGGCVWLRLLEIKNQLTDFDENFRVEVVDRHFTVHFHDPVLLGEDVVYLSKLHPRGELPGAKGDQWFLDFRMSPVRKEEQARQVITFGMRFDAEQRLKSFDFSPLFLELAPAAFLEASIRSLGLGTVDQEKRQLKVDPEHLPKLAGPLPSRLDIVTVLGPPEEDYVYENLRILRYRFLCECRPVSAKYESRREADAKLFFAPDNDRLVRLSGRFAGLKLSIDYRKLTLPEEPKRP